MTGQVRRRSDARDNRARILAAARSAFAASGPSVPVREIARRAQVAPATVYRHFATKDALLAEALRLTRCSEIVEKGLAVPDPGAGFRQVVRALMEHRTSPVPPPDAPADRDRTLGMLQRLLARAKADGAVRPDIVLEDVVLALMANDGITAASPPIRTAAARRFAALIIRSFQPAPSLPLPPAVHLPLPPHRP